MFNLNSVTMKTKNSQIEKIRRILKANEMLKIRGGDTVPKQRDGIL
jgi:hypothetical protein